MDRQRLARQPGRQRRHMIRLVAIAVTAASVASGPAWTAATSPAASGRACEGRPDCPPPESGLAGAVSLPDLIVDLFPNPAVPNTANGPGGNSASGNNPTGPAQGTAGTPPDSPPIVVPVQAIAGDHVPDEVLATVDGGSATAQQVAERFGLQVRGQRISALLGATIVRYGIPDGRPVSAVLASLAGDSRVLRREANHVYTLQQAASVANYAFGRIALDPGSATGENVRIAVIDTAVDAEHPALRGVIADQFDAMPDIAVSDRDHGTSIGGLIAGVAPLEGIAPGAQLYHARAFEGGRSTMDVILSALDWAAEQDVRIINMSFVGPKNELMGMACANARARGLVLVAAAGNNGPGAPYGYPAAFPGVIAVTATDAADQLMQQANRGPYVHIAAPGVDMIAPVGGGSDLVTGTSFAAAVASGAIANLIHKNPGLSAEQIETILATTATDLGAEGRDDDFGHGLLNTQAAFAAR